MYIGSNVEPCALKMGTKFNLLTTLALNPNTQTLNLEPLLLPPNVEAREL